MVQKINKGNSVDLLSKDYLSNVFYPAVGDVIYLHFLNAKENYSHTNKLNKLDKVAHLLLFLITKGNLEYISNELISEIKNFVDLENKDNSFNVSWSATYPFELIINLVCGTKYNYSYFINNWKCNPSVTRKAIQEFALWAYYKYDKSFVLDVISHNINSLQFGYDIILAILCNVINEFDRYQINRMLYLDRCNNPIDGDKLFSYNVQLTFPLNEIKNIKITNSFFSIISEAKDYFIKIIIEALPHITEGTNKYQLDLFAKDWINFAYQSENEHFKKLNQITFYVDIRN